MHRLLNTRRDEQKLASARNLHSSEKFVYLPVTTLFLTTLFVAKLMTYMLLKHTFMCALLY